MRRALAGATVAAALLGGACGGDDDALPDDPTFDQCADRFVAALADFDTTGIEVGDGLDDAERRLAEERFTALGEDEPALAEDSPCQDVIADGSDAEVSAMVARLDAEVAAILGAGSAQPLDQVESEIGG